MPAVFPNIAPPLFEQERAAALELLAADFSAQTAQLRLEVNAHAVGGIERGLGRGPCVAAVVVEPPLLRRGQHAHPVSGFHRRVAGFRKDARVVLAAQKDRLIARVELRALGVEIDRRGRAAQARDDATALDILRDEGMDVGRKLAPAFARLGSGQKQGFAMHALFDRAEQRRLIVAQRRAQLAVGASVRIQLEQRLHAVLFGDEPQQRDFNVGHERERDFAQQAVPVGLRVVGHLMPAPHAGIVVHHERERVYARLGRPVVAVRRDQALERADFMIVEPERGEFRALDKQPHAPIGPLRRYCHAAAVPRFAHMAVQPRAAHCVVRHGAAFALVLFVQRAGQGYHIVKVRVRGAFTRIERQIPPAAQIESVNRHQASSFRLQG